MSRPEANPQPQGGVGEPDLRSLIDDAYYRERNPDVVAADLDPVYHFTTTGKLERRHVHPQLERLLGYGFRHGFLESTQDLLRFLPLPVAVAATAPAWWSRLEEFFQPDFYAALAAEAGLSGEALGDLLCHFLLVGVDAGLRPSILFDARHYATVAPEVDGAAEALERRPFLHWLTWGAPGEVVPTTLFDQAWYEAAHPDVTDYDGWSFRHFYLYGAREPRQPSQRFDVGCFRRRTLNARHPVHLVDHALNHPRLGCAPGLNLRSGGASLRIADDTPLEAFGRLAASHARALEAPLLREIVERAGEIEPLIWQPTGRRRIVVPPVCHDQNAVRQLSEAVLACFGDARCDVAVLIPHCRVGGAARVAGAFQAALRRAYPAAGLAVVTTESDEFQRPDWFAGARVIDVSLALKDGPESLRRQAMANALRALGCRTAVTVNSRLGWDVVETYGAQLSSEMRLAAYLFTYDLNGEGRKVGYPIAPLQVGFDHLDLVLTDNATLKRELVERYRMPEGSAARIQALYTPADPVEIDLSDRDRAGAGAPRVIWAGRFDRQKRFDVVVELARAWPTLQVWAWGKAVIGDFAFSPEDLPPNIDLRGEFESFDELPLAEADLLLYTSQWDGLPTLLIDAGLRGMTVVASDVGGVGELVDETTGWPVTPPTDPTALRAAIEAALAAPEEARRRAAALRERTRRMTAPEAYDAAVATLFPELAKP